MVNTKDLIKIKEYDRYVLFKHKAGYMECILKVDLLPPKAERGKWER